jgi:hypothetical protein
MDKLEASLEEAKKCLAAVRAGDEPIDMGRLKRLLKKQLRESLASLESDPHHAVAFRCIGDALYSQNEQDVSIIIYTASFFFFLPTPISGVHDVHHVMMKIL